MLSVLCLLSCSVRWRHICFFGSCCTRKQSANSRSSLPAAHVGTIGHAAVASVPGVPTRTLSLLAPALPPMPLLAWSALPMPMVHRTCRASTSRVLVALCSVVRLICLRACPAASCPCGTLCPSHAGTRHCKQVSILFKQNSSQVDDYVSSQSITITRIRTTACSWKTASQSALARGRGRVHDCEPFVAHHYHRHCHCHWQPNARSIE